MFWYKDFWIINLIILLVIYILGKSKNLIKKCPHLEQQIPLSPRAIHQRNARRPLQGRGLVVQVAQHGQEGVQAHPPGNQQVAGAGLHRW